MSIDPVWHFFRVAPDEVTQVQEAFDRAVRQSRIAEQTQAFFESQQGQSNDFDSFYESYGNIFDLFYPEAFTELFDDVVTDKLQLAERSLEFVMTNRFGASAMLFYALGWELSHRLPGYFGNLFVSPNDVANVLAEVEQVFNAINAAEFVERAEEAGSLGNCNGDVAGNLASLLPASLRTVLAEGDGLLALNYPHAGCIPYPGYEDEEYEG